MCPDLFLLSAIACNLAKCLNTDELNILSVNLTALGDMLQVILASQENTDS